MFIFPDLQGAEARRMKGIRRLISVLEHDRGEIDQRGLIKYLLD